MAKRRGVVIGCGFFAVNHLNGWMDLKDRCEIVAVCDRDGAKAEAAANTFGIARHYTDVADMLAREKPDFADIVTTVESHRPLVELCAAHGVGAIVQKPLAPDWADAVALVSAMHRAGKPLMVHENFRFQRPMLRAKEVLASGEIGRPIWGRFSWRTNYDVYAGQPYLAHTKRFILMDIGVHVLDLARFFLGEASEAYCHTSSIKPGIAGEDMATVMLRHESGVTSVNDFTYESRQTPEVFPQTLLHIEGTQGSISMGADFRMSVTAPSGPRIEMAKPVTPAWGNPRWALIQESVVNTQTHWLDSLDAGRPADISGADNLKTFALVEACYESAATGRAVKPAAANL
jgi:predicted dehydrogenase